MKENTPISVEELKKRREKILEKNEKEKKTTVLAKIAIWITEHVGSMGFFIIIFTWTVTWLGWNTLGPKNLRFDPYPGFVLWLFISNMIQLFTMPLILLGQNIQSKASDSRDEADLQINSQSALENETILIHLENQNEMMMKILKAIEKEEKQQTKKSKD
jgi:uncharacterized membrane protein